MIFTVNSMIFWRNQMKVERKQKAFEPVVITLENKEELIILLRTIGAAEYRFISDSCSLDRDTQVAPFLNALYHSLQDV